MQLAELKWSKKTDERFEKAYMCGEMDSVMQSKRQLSRRIKRMLGRCFICEPPHATSRKGYVSACGVASRAMALVSVIMGNR